MLTNKQTILVTGGAGYIGSHTTVELLSNGYNAVILDNLSNSSEVAIERIGKICNRKPAFIKGDITNPSDCERVFSEHKIDAVIHFAGLKAVGESVKFPHKYYYNNVYGTLNLLNAMQKASVNKIVFSSSATVYGFGKPPLTEDSALSTASPYGTTKLFIEYMLKDFANSNSQLTAVILRYFNPIGAHKSGLIGEDPSGIPNNLAPYITQVVVGKLSKLSVFGNDYPTRDGSGVRDYIDVNDLARGHIAALERVKTSGTHIYNLGTGKGTSVFELLAAFERAANKKIPHVVAPRRSGDVAECYAAVDKAERELGWKAETTIDEMCKTHLNWQLKNPNGYNS